MAKIALNTDYIEPQGKHDAGFFRIEIDQVSPIIPTTEFLITPNPYDEGSVKVSIALDADKFSGGQERLRESVKALIEHSGIEGLELKLSEHRNNDSIVLRTGQPEDLTRIAQAISKNVDLGQGATVYGIIDSSVVTAVADELSQAMGGKEYGFDDEPKTAVPYLEARETHDFSVTPSSDEQREYLTVKSNIEGTSIEQISSESQWASDKSGGDINVEFTRVDIAPDRVSAVSSILQRAGLAAERHGYHLNVDAPIQSVSKALSEAGLIPSSVHSEIATQRAELKGDFATSAQMTTVDEAMALKATADADGMLARVQAEGPKATV